MANHKKFNLQFSWWKLKSTYHFTRFLKEVTLTDSGEYNDQYVTLQDYQASLNAFSKNYRKFISKVNGSAAGRFSELQKSAIFTNLAIILDCKKCSQTNEQFMNFGDDEIQALKVHLMAFLEKNSF